MSTLKLVKTKPQTKKLSASRLRAGIIEGTCGKDAGPYPKLPVGVQRTLDRKARALADETFEVIRESLMRNVGCHCFYGLSYERFDADQAQELIAEMTLDKALTPLVRKPLEWAQIAADSMLNRARDFQDEMSKQLAQFNLPNA